MRKGVLAGGRDLRILAQVKGCVEQGMRAASFAPTVPREMTVRHAPPDAKIGVHLPIELVVKQQGALGAVGQDPPADRRIRPAWRLPLASAGSTRRAALVASARPGQEIAQRSIMVLALCTLRLFRGKARSCGARADVRGTADRLCQASSRVRSLGNGSRGVNL